MIVTIRALHGKDDFFLRVIDSIHNTFRCVRENEIITRCMLEDRRSMEECAEKKLAFFKSIPDSVQYWIERKKDFFVLIPQIQPLQMIRFY